MFYSDVILSKKGKLSKVWLAAHAERRMTKTMILDTNVTKSVSTIINKRDDQDAIPMALRLSGQLLFGVVRIYSRQAKYLLDDCNEALMKLKTAFRAGAVDMTLQTSRSAITLANRPAIFDMNLPDPTFEGWDVNSVRSGSVARSVRSQSYTARPEDITRQRAPAQPIDEQTEAWRMGDFFDADAEADVELDLGEASGIIRRDSQGREVDANGDLIESDGSSVGVGRDAPSQIGRQSLNIGEMTEDIQGAGVDLQQQQDDIFDLGLEAFDAERNRAVTPTRQIGAESSLMQDLTPRTALKVQQAAEKRAAAAVSGGKQKKVVFDSRTELLDDRTRREQTILPDATGSLIPERYLPRSRAYMQLLEYQANPTRHILPFLTSGGITTFTGARGLAPQLSELFTFDANILRRQRSDSEDVEEDGMARKRQRTESNFDDDASIEIGRRAERESVAGVDITGLGEADFTMDDFDGNEGTPFDLPEIEADVTITESGPRRSQRKRISSPARQANPYDQRGDLPRLATPSVSAEGDAESSVLESPSSSNLLRAFDGHVAEDATDLAAETIASTQAGLSKNTVRAIKVLQKGYDLEAEERSSRRGATQVERELSFEKITVDATRRSAASFFFELLVLGSKDAIHIEQQEGYGDIKIRTEPSLWQQSIAQVS